MLRVYPERKVYSFYFIKTLLQKWLFYQLTDSG